MASPGSSLILLAPPRSPGSSWLPLASPGSYRGPRPWAWKADLQTQLVGAWASSLLFGWPYCLLIIPALRPCEQKCPLRPCEPSSLKAQRATLPDNRSSFKHYMPFTEEPLKALRNPCGTPRSILYWRSECFQPEPSSLKALRAI